MRFGAAAVAAAVFAVVVSCFLLLREGELRFGAAAAAAATATVAVAQGSYAS